MKKSTKLSALLATLLCLLVCFCSCSTYGRVFKAFEKEGYYESDTVASYAEKVKNYLTYTDEEGNEVEPNVTLHVVYKDVTHFAVIADYKTTKEMVEQYENSTDFKNLVNSLEKSDRINGTCVLLLESTLLTHEILDIFKNA